MRLLQRQPLLIAVSISSLYSATELWGQSSCPDGGIGAIVIENRSIFDPAELPEDGRFLWAYRLANSVHIATREEFIANALLFSEGDCFEPAALRETERILREYRFIARADVSSVRQSDGTERVVVNTRDEWSTKLTINVRFEDRFRFEGVSLLEENLLGKGITLGLFRVDRDVRRDLGIAIEVPKVTRLGLDARLAVSRTRGGSGFDEALVYPFHGESRATAVRQRVSHRDDLFAYALSDDPEFSHLVIPVRIDGFEASGARRFGEPGDFYMLGGGVSYERVAVGRAESVEGIRPEDFSGGEVVGTEYTDPLLTQLGTREALRLNLLFGVRRLRFAARRGFDTVDGVQDLPVGSEVLLSLGRTVGDTGPDRPGDLFSRLDLLRGTTGDRHSSVLTASVEGRLEDSILDTRQMWRDLFVEGHGFLYLTGRGSPRHTGLLRVAVQAGWRTTGPFQLTLGGQDGVRSYTENQLPGGRRVVVSLEDRIRVGSLLPELFDLGITVFGDYGRAWSGGAPFGVDSGWRGALGAGIRLGFPPGSSSVIRADLAFPVGPGASSQRPVLRITAREWVGVLNDFRSPQLARARRAGIQGRYIGVARERTVW